MTGDAIRLESIVKSYSGVTVLKDVTLRVRAGEVLALIGSNGAGKTTLLEILATAQLPTSGHATVGGFDLVRQPGEIRRIIGHSGAADSFYPQLTGRANLEFFAALYGLSAGEARTRIRTVLETLDAGAVAEVAVQRCSAGMKQKLSLARALLADPPILLLDEPTRSVDADARDGFHRWLRQTCAGAMQKTVLLVTHDPHEARGCCDRVALLRGGAIVRVWAIGEFQAGAIGAVPARSRGSARV